MLTFKIPFNNPDLIDVQQANLINLILREELEKKRFLMPFCRSGHWLVDATGITIIYEGVSLDQKDKTRTSYPMGNFVMRELAEIIRDLNLESVVTLTHFGDQPVVGDKVIPASFYKPDSTINNKLLTESGLIEDSDIPDEFKCTMTSQIMDQAAYIVTKPEIKYNYAHIKYWIYSSNKAEDPLNRQNVSSDKIKIDNELTDRIKVFVAKAQKEGLEKRKATFIQIMNKYGFDVINATNIEAAFRRAAAESNLSDLTVLERKVPNIDSQDNRGRTALHWAIVNGCVEVAKFLKSKKARVDIPNAEGLTATILSEKSSNPEIKALFEVVPFNQNRLDEILGRKFKF